MKYVAMVASVTAVLVAGPAFAQSNRNNSNSSSGAVAVVNGDTVYNPSRIKQRVATSSSAIAPGLTAAGVHSCAGSVSVGASVTGFNFGFGSTYEMQECNRRAYAATLAGMGQNAAALALICNNPEVQNALNMTGVVCPQQRVATASAWAGGPVPGPVPAAYASTTAGPGPTNAPPAGYKWVPNPEYQQWEMEQQARRRHRR